MPSVEDPDDMDEFSLVEGLKFAPALKVLLNQVHPNHQLTRNTQHGMNDFVSLMLATVCKLLKSKQLTFSTETMLTILPDVITGELVKHAKCEMGKLDSCEEAVYTVVREYVIEKFPDLCDNSDSEEWIHGVKSSTKLLEYLICEVLELAGNSSRDASTYCIGMGHISLAIEGDEELKDVFQHITFGQLSAGVLNISSLRQIETIQTLHNKRQTKGQVKHDDFIDNQVCNVYNVTYSTRSSRAAEQQVSSRKRC